MYVSLKGKQAKELTTEVKICGHFLNLYGIIFCRGGYYPPAPKQNLPKALPFGEGGFAKQRQERFEVSQNATSSVLTAAQSLVNPPSPKGKAILGVRSTQPKPSPAETAVSGAEFCYAKHRGGIVERCEHDDG